MKRTTLLIASIVTLLTMLNSCTESVSPYAPNSWSSVDPDTYFDFSTTVSVPVTIKFDSKTLVYIFDPNTHENDGRMNLLFSAFTDDNGYYRGSVEIPAAALDQNLVAIADGYRCKSVVTTSGVTFEAHYSEDVNSRAENGSRSTTITQDKILGWCNELSKLYKGDATHTGRFPEGQNNLSKIEDKNDICLNIIKDHTELTFSFVHSGGRYMSAVYYYYYPEDHDIRNNENMNSVDKIYTFVKSHEDKFLLTKDWNCMYTSFFLYNSDLARSIGIDALGNGWIGEKPASVDEDYNKMKAADTDNDGYIGVFYRWDEYPSGYVNRNFNNQVGASNPILFYGEDYNEPAQTEFPAGYRVGFLLDVIPINDMGTPSEDHLLLCTHKMLNKTQYPQAARALKALNVDNYGNILDDGIVNIVYGFEDTANKTNEYMDDNRCDLDFNDMMFMITATPKVSTANIPVVGEGAAINGGTLMFEDLYPEAGDYDMNDVIVEYEFVKKFGDDNILTSVEYQFWPLHYGATYRDDFYFTIEPTANTNHFDVEPILVFNSAELLEGARQNEAVVQQMLHLPYTKTGSLDVAGKKIPSNSFNTDIFNPFIYVHNTERQVHLVNKPFVKGVGNSTQAGIYDEGTLKYHPLLNNHDGAYFPFAMNVPLRYTDDSHTRFRPVKESVRIDNETQYYKFLDWMVSGGTEYKEWYFYYNGDLEW